MTNAAPSLRELTAQIVIQNNDIDQLRLVMPDEMITYLRTLSGEIPLELATVFYDKYAEIVAALAAIGDQQADTEITEQFLQEYQQLLHKHDEAAEALTTALAAAVSAPDPQWREYLMTILAEVQENVTVLGQRVETAVEYFTTQRDAAAEYEKWLAENPDSSSDSD
jgi:hypothetical protein